MDKFILPNFHAILIHFPMGMLGLGVTIELLSVFWRRSSFRQAGQWLILLGTLAAVPAVTSGLYALRDVMAQGGEASSWTEYKAGVNFTQTDWNFVRMHIILNSAATGLALIAVVVWLASTDTWRKILRLPALLMLMAACGLMVDGAWHGGEMVYRLGFAVQGKLGTVPDSPDKPESLEDKIEYYAPEGELHLLLAGCVFSLAAVTLGLSIRRAMTTDTVLVQRIPPTYVPASADRDSVKPISLLQALNDPGDEIPVIPAIPAARFWLLAMLVTIAAIGSGLWFGDYLTSWPMMINRDHFVHAFQNIKIAGKAREGLHIAFGTSILALMLVMAMITRFAPRSRVILSAFGFLLVMAMAGQIWLGVLLTFDGSKGPLVKFQPEAPEQQPLPTQPSMSPTSPATQPMTVAQ